MYQVYHNSLPDQLTALFTKRNIDSNYNLRRITDFPYVRCNSDLGRNSARYRGPIVWNLLPKAIKDFFFFFFIVCKITLLTLLTVRAKYITRQYSILPTIHAYWLLTLLNKTGLYLQFNTDSLKHNSN